MNIDKQRNLHCKFVNLQCKYARYFSDEKAVLSVLNHCREVSDCKDKTTLEINEYDALLKIHHTIESLLDLKIYSIKPMI